MARLIVEDFSILAGRWHVPCVHTGLLRAYPNNASAFVMLSNAKHLAIGNPGANVL